MNKAVNLHSDPTFFPRREPRRNLNDFAEHFRLHGPAIVITCRTACDTGSTFRNIANVCELDFTCADLQFNYQRA